MSSNDTDSLTDCDRTACSEVDTIALCADTASGTAVEYGSDLDPAEVLDLCLGEDLAGSLCLSELGCSLLVSLGDLLGSLLALDLDGVNDLLACFSCSCLSLINGIADSLCLECIDELVLCNDDFAYPAIVAKGVLRS